MLYEGSSSSSSFCGPATTPCLPRLNRRIWFSGQRRGHKRIRAVDLITFRAYRLSREKRSFMRAEAERRGRIKLNREHTTQHITATVTTTTTNTLLLHVLLLQYYYNYNYHLRKALLFTNAVAIIEYYSWVREEMQLNKNALVSRTCCARCVMHTPSAYRKKVTKKSLKSPKKVPNPKVYFYSWRQKWLMGTSRRAHKSQCKSVQKVPYSSNDSAGIQIHRTRFEYILAPSATLP